MKNKKIVILAILVAFAIPMSTQIPAAGIQNVAESFPDASETTVALIVTLPILVASLFALIAGKVAGSVIEFKKLILAALVFFTAGGVAPFFFSESLGLVLAFRVVCGIGIGLLSPLGATLVVKLIDSEEAQGKAMGIGSIVLNISGIVYVSLAGALADSHWSNMFLVYLVGLLFIPIIIFTLPNIPLEKDTKEEVTATKERINFAMIAIALMCFLMAILEYPVHLNMSSVVITENLGTSATAGIIIAMYTIGGIVGSAIYARFSKLTKDYTTSAARLITAGGLLILFFGGNATILAMGNFLIGLSFGIYYPAFYMLMGRAAPASLTALGMSLIMVGYDGGGFVSPYFFSVVRKVTGNEGVRFPFLFSSIAFTAVTLIVVMITRKRPLIPANTTSVEEKAKE